MSIPAIPPGIAGADLIAAVNDRIRRINLALSAQTGGAATPASTPTPRPVPAPSGGAAALGLSFAGPTAIVGVAYSGTLAGSGGTPGYTYSIPLGGLPAGLSLVGATIQGTPTTAGTFGFTAMVTDAASNIATRVYSIVVQAAAAGASPATLTALAVSEVASSRVLEPDASTHTTLAVTPTATGGSGTQIVTVYLSHDGGSNYAWQGEFNWTSGAIHLDYLIYTKAECGGLTSNNVKAYAVIGAVAGSYATIASASLPAGGQFSSTLTVLLGAPNATHVTFAITNALGSAPTEANIYMGLNSLGNPWALVNILFTAAGQNDPNCWYYQATVEWTDSSGTAIAPGGGNASGPQAGAQWVNSPAPTAQPWQSGGSMGLWIGYPGVGIDGYLNITITGYNRDGTGTLQEINGSATYYRLHVGPPPATYGPSIGFSNLTSAGATIDAIVAYGANTLANSDFSQGLLGWTPQSGTTGWTTSGTRRSTQVGLYSATQVAPVTASTLYVLGQFFAVLPGDVVSCSGYGNPTGASDASFGVGVDFYDATGTICTLPGGGIAEFTGGAPLSPGTWNQASCISAPAPANAVSAEFFFYVETNTDTVPVLCASAMCVRSQLATGITQTLQNGVLTPAIASGNIATSSLWDPGFESDLAGYLGPGGAWTPSTGTYPPKIIATGGNSGPQFCELIGPSCFIEQSLSVVAGTPYYFQFYVKSVSNTQNLSYTLSWYNASGGLISSNAATLSGTVGSWSQVNPGAFTAPSAAASVTVEFETSASEGATTGWAIDDVYFQAVVAQVASDGSKISTTPGGSPTLAQVIFLNSGATAKSSLTSGALNITSGSAQALLEINLLELVDGIGNAALLTPSGFTQAGAHTPFTGSLGSGRNCIGGIVY